MVQWPVLVRSGAGDRGLCFNRMKALLVVLLGLAA